MYPSMSGQTAIVYDYASNEHRSANAVYRFSYTLWLYYFKRIDPPANTVRLPGYEMPGHRFKRTLVYPAKDPVEKSITKGAGSRPNARYKNAQLYFPIYKTTNKPRGSAAHRKTLRISIAVQSGPNYQRVAGSQVPYASAQTGFRTTPNCT